MNEFLECHLVHIVKPFFRLHHSSAEKEVEGSRRQLRTRLYKQKDSLKHERILFVYNSKTRQILC